MARQTRFASEQLCICLCVTPYLLMVQYPTWRSALLVMGYVVFFALLYAC